MSVYLSRPFWRAALERATKTAAQGVVAGGITGAVVTDGHVLVAVALTAVVGFAASILTSIASAQVGESGTPSLTSAETLTTGVGDAAGAPSVFGA